MRANYLNLEIEVALRETEKTVDSVFEDGVLDANRSDRSGIISLAFQLEAEAKASGFQ
jgi:hypothetical protein